MSRQLKLIGLGLAVIVAWGCRRGEPVAEGEGGQELLDELMAEAPAEAPAEEPAEAPAEPPAEAPAEEPAEAPAEPTAEAPAEEPAEAPAEPTAEAPAEEPAAPPTPYDELFEKMETAEEAPLGRREEAEREFQMGKKLYDDWRYEEALGHFKKAVVAWPKHPEAGKYVERTRAMLNVRLDVQRAHLTDLEGQASRDLQETLFQLQRTIARARGLYERALTAQPDDDPTAPRDAMISRQMRDLNEGIRLYERAQEIMRWLPYPVDVSGLKAQVASGLVDARAVVVQREDELTNLRIQKSVEEKEAVRRRMEEMEERRIETLVRSTRELYRYGKYVECEAMCQRILRIDPNEDRARAIMAKSRSTRHALAESETYHRHELEQDKTMAMIDDATTQYHKVLNYPENWSEISRRGEIGGFEEAEPEWKRSIRQRLEQKVSFEFMDTPLDQAVTFLREVSQVNIILDPAVVGATPPRVTLNMKNVPMRLALEWILKLASLQYELKDNAVFISNKAGLRPDLVMRIYDVQDLTITIPDFPGPEFSLQTGGGAAPPVLGGAGGPGGGVTGMTTTAIVDMLRQRVAPQTWDPAFGTSIDESQGKLVIMQTPEVHRLISNLLSKFRSQSKLLVVVESRFLRVREGLFEEIGIDWHDGTGGVGGTPTPPGFIDTGDPASFFGGEGRLATLGTLVGSNIQFAPDATQIAGGHPYFAGNTGGLNAQIDHVGDAQVQALLHALKIRENGLILTAPRLTVHNGQRAHMFVGTERSYLSGVTVAGDTPDPQVSTIMSGVVLDVRPIVSYNRHYITLELRPTIAEEGVPNIFNTTFFTTTAGDPPVVVVNTFPIEAPSLEIIQVRTTVTIPDGGIILIGGLMQDIQFQAENGVPVISNIPVLGRLFRWNRTDNERSNLAVLVTARSLLFEEEEEKL